MNKPELGKLKQIAGYTMMFIMFGALLVLSNDVLTSNVPVHSIGIWRVDKVEIVNMVLGGKYYRISCSTLNTTATFEYSRYGYIKPAPDLQVGQMYYMSIEGHELLSWTGIE